MENPIMKNILANLPKAPKQVDYMPINMELEFANGITSGSGSNTSGSSTMIHTSGSNTDGINTSGSSNSDYMEIVDETKVSSNELRKTPSSSATYTILPTSRSSSSSVKEVLHASGSNTGGSNTSGNNTSGNNSSGNNSSGSNTSGSNASGSNTRGSNASGSNVSGSKNSDYMEIEDETKVSSIATNSSGKILEKSLENDSICGDEWT